MAGPRATTDQGEAPLERSCSRRWAAAAGVTDAITGRRSAEGGDLRRTHSNGVTGRELRRSGSVSDPLRRRPQAAALGPTSALSGCGPASRRQGGGASDAALSGALAAVELDALLSRLAGVVLADVMADVLAGGDVERLVCDDGPQAGDDFGLATGPDRVLELVNGRSLPG